MTARRKTNQPAPHEEWSWPFDLAWYVRRTGLTPAEALALKKYACLKMTGPRENLPILRTAMPRLLKPIDDVFDYTQPKHFARLPLTVYLLRETSCRRRSFWGWTSQEWIETINNCRAERHHIIALAYLLCGFSQLRDIRRGHMVPTYLGTKSVRA